MAGRSACSGVNIGCFAGQKEPAVPADGSGPAEEDAGVPAPGQLQHLWEDLQGAGHPVQPPPALQPPRHQALAAQEGFVHQGMEQAGQGKKKSLCKSYKWLIAESS